MKKTELSIIEKTMEILDASIDYLECTNNLFAYFKSLMPISKLILGRFDIDKLQYFIVSSTDNKGTVSYYKNYPIEYPDKRPIEPKILYALHLREEKVVSDPNEPAARIRDFLSDVDITLPVLAIKSTRENIHPGSGALCFEPNVPLPENIHEIANAIKLPLNILTTNCVRYWKLEQEKQQIFEENRELRKKAAGLLSTDIIGASAGLKHSVEMLHQVGPLEVPLLIHGETGTGKELFAKAAHELSPRRKAPFVAVNCGAIPENLIDNELFGHSKGAFTGATEVYRGKFERASGGTLFLDEIGELPLQVQSRLLRVLETKKIERLGSSELIATNFRLICATHRDLKAMVAEGTFRQDLYYRLAVVTLEIPALRERPQDIPLLTHFFLEKIAQRNRSIKAQILDEDLSALCAEPWPGNVRELQNCIEAATALKKSNVLYFAKFRQNSELHSLSSKKSQEQLSTDKPNFPLFPYEAMMQEYLTLVLNMCQGKINGEKGLAELLDINPSTLRAKLRKYAIPFGRK